MSKFNKFNIEISPTENTREWILLKAIRYKGHTVPIRFVFDGASIPAIFFLRDIFPHGGKKMFAACLHDFLYRRQYTTRLEADLLFREAMLANGVGKAQAEILYRGVRAGGGFTWAKRRRD